MAQVLENAELEEIEAEIKRKKDTMNCPTIWENSLLIKIFIDYLYYVLGSTVNVGYTINNMVFCSLILDRQVLRRMQLE